MFQLRTVSIYLVLLVCTSFAFSQDSSLGMFEGHNDIGELEHKGTVQYDTETQNYTLSGSGANMWFGEDEFHFVWKKMKGNFILRAHIRFDGEGVDLHRKAGWIVRNTMEKNSPHVNASLHGDGLMSLQFRRTPGGETEQEQSDLNGPNVVQLERHGNTYTMSVAKYGDTFVTEEITGDFMEDEVYVGLYVCSHNATVSETAVFENVRMVIPAADDFRPYRDYIGSRIEVMDIETGHRKVLHEELRSLQAPNWTQDGKTLIYNSEGLLYNFDLATNTPSVMDTGFANRNNNDHVISFDGKQIGISHHGGANGSSMVYTLPITGGIPIPMTKTGPSYFHGWSPDDKTLVFTGGRNDQYDIYTVPSDGSGVETQLTNLKTLDDGPEYTPDGKYIYFNSARTGTMKIWRMKPDGSNQEQITFDEYNDWFPHISPDGKKIVILSFPPEVDAADHPFYKRVNLRLLPIEGGTPKVIAYIYGGQGTINVPSWSPDSTKIAFVSNSVIE